MNRLLRILLLVLALPAAAHSAVIQGKVEAKDGGALPGANVLLENTTLGASTDRDGRFVIYRVPPGTWTVRVSMMGYETARQTVRVHKGETVQLHFVLRQDVLEMNPLIVVASKKEEELMRAPVSVGVISSAEITRRGISSIPEAISYVPGLFLISGQANIRNSSGFMYGAGTRVLFLIDGIPVHASDTGEINWDLIPLVDVDHVEIIKGAGSFLFGANALGGVINIVTRRPSEKSRWILQGNAGIYDKPYYREWEWTSRLLHYDRLDFSYSRRWGKLGVQFSARRDASTGYMQANHHHRYSGTLKLTYTFRPGSELTLYGAYMRDKRGEFVMWRDQKHVFLAMDEESAGNTVKLRHAYLYGIYRHVFSPKFSAKVRFSYNNVLMGNQYDRPGEFFPAIGPGTELSAVWIPSVRHQFLFGVEYKTDRAKNKWIGEHNAYTISPYLQYELKPVAAVTVTAGVRVDHYKLDDRQPEQNVSPRLGLNWLLNPKFSLRASVGWGFRPPVIVERFLRLSLAGFEVLPNPELKSERARSAELGVRWRWGATGLLDFSLFRNDYWDMIQPTIDITSNSIQFLNIARPRIRGAELSLRLNTWRRHLNLEASYTLTENVDLKTGLPLFYRPRRLAKILPSFRWGAFEVQLEYHYASRIERVEVYPLDERVPMHLWNLRLSWHLGTLQLYTYVHNLFNYNYTLRERRLEPIRNYMVGFSFAR